jgi:hypothetical protein
MERTFESVSTRRSHSVMIIILHQGNHRPTPSNASTLQLGNSHALHMVNRKFSPKTPHKCIHLETPSPPCLSQHPVTIISANHTQVHSAKTHHLALRSASTNPRHTPRSPTLIIVSQVPPSPFSVLKSVLCILSSFLINRKTLPPGA